MALNPIQSNIENHQVQHTYRDAKPAIKTPNYIKPFPAEGHLVHDTIKSVPKFWLKDIAYDIKAVKDGFKGTANDHQAGRLNDVGLRTAGLGIAAYLASRTSNPKERLMEYVGLGAFLSSMSLYPKLAINGPSRLVHGFDIGKEYIDDQGRKKSVFQDSNYIPFDMYRGEFPGEDLDIIGDRMGIPRDIKNRHEIIKEQMRKIATQNNTLWMLTAGFATPVMAALICAGLDKTISKTVENIRNYKNNLEIKYILDETKNADLNVSSIENNNLSGKIEKLVNKLKGKEISSNDVENISKILTDETDAFLSKGIKSDIEHILRGDRNAYSIGDDVISTIIDSIRTSLPGRNRATLEKVFLPTGEELRNIIENIQKNSKEISTDELYDLRGALKGLFSKKIEKEPLEVQKYLKAVQNNILLDSLTVQIKSKPMYFMNEEAAADIIDFAKVLGDFKAKQQILDKCKNFKMEYAPETILARSYQKFQNAFMEVLGIKDKELELIKESEKDAAKILQERIEALVKNDKKYSSAVKNLSKISAEMDAKLDGKSSEVSYLKDLITAIENNYNNTAKRLNSIGENKFSDTINMLVKEDVKTLSNTIDSKSDLFKFLDGTKERSQKQGLDYVKELANGTGSAKKLEISEIADRYAEVKTPFNRVLQTLDMFRRQIPSTEYDKTVLAKAKEVLLNATSTDHTLKLGTDNNPEFYKSIMRTICDTNGINESTKTAMNSVIDISGKDTSSRYQEYLTRFFNVLGGNDIDFTKPEHIIGSPKIYAQDSITRKAKFNLVSQSPVDMLRDGAKNKIGPTVWLRKAAFIGAAVFAVTILAQFSFGKIKNPHNIQKQVSDDTNI